MLAWFTTIWLAIKKLLGGSTPPATDWKRPFWQTQFLFAGQRAHGLDNSMQFFGDKVSDAERQWDINFQRDMGSNLYFAFMISSGGGDAGMVTFYKDRGKIGGEVDQAQVDLRKRWGDKILNAGMQPMWCMFCCERSGQNVSDARILSANPVKICNDIMPVLEYQGPLWVSCLEAEKNFDGGTAQRIAMAMAPLTASPVGIHSSKLEYISGPFTMRHMRMNDGSEFDTDAWTAWEHVAKGRGRIAKTVQSGYDLILYERGESPQAWNSVSPEQSFDDSKRVSFSIREPKRYMGFEYSLGKKDDQHERQGLAWAFATTSSCVGVGSGAPVGLWKMMQQLPRGIAGERIGSRVQFIGQGYRAFGDLSLGTFWKE